MPSKHQPVVLVLLLALATLAVYYPVRHLPFINYDDDLYVTENVHVQSGLEWDTVQWAFTTYAASNWHPLTWLSHALDVQFFSLDPVGPHVVNLLLHMFNVVLLFWVLWRATGCTGRSAMVAALFALHPINVQSVAWVAERKNLLSMLFFLLALGAYRWYARSSFEFPVSSFEEEAPPSRRLSNSRKLLPNWKLETQNSKLSFHRYLV